MKSLFDAAQAVVVAFHERSSIDDFKTAMRDLEIFVEINNNANPRRISRTRLEEMFNLLNKVDNNGHSCCCSGCVADERALRAVKKELKAELDRTA